MCRFLLVKSAKSLYPKTLLTKFAKIVSKSRSYDGDRHNDGWGIAWVGNDKRWQLKKSLTPIWEEVSTFNQFPKTKFFVVHARSSSFDKDKKILSYNQPYIDHNYAFVFNGLLKGVSLSKVPGDIGAEKIWYLLKKELKKNNVVNALKKTKKLLIENSKEIIALNIGLAVVRENKIYSLSYFTKYAKYYQLYRFKNSSREIICSEVLK